MASVVKRKLKSGFVYYVSYRAPDKQGLPKQHWIRCNSEREAEDMLPTVRAAEKEGHGADAKNQNYGAQACPNGGPH